MTLSIIGVGLNDERDITVKGLELIQKSDVVYLEQYTSLLQVSNERLEEFYGKKIISATRSFVENGKELISQAKSKNVCLLIIGDIFSATTHFDIYTRALQENIAVNLVHNTSIMTAIGVTGLMLYNFGKTTSIPFPQENFKPETAYDVLLANQSLGLHTLILLDLKPEENKYMAIREGLSILSGIAKSRGQTMPAKVLGCARMGGDNRVIYGTPQELETVDFGQPPHCIIFPGKLHFVEEEALKRLS